ncbi:response regulator transcription factor [Cohnella soli]|uniref:Response regulator n=1 Tax=Cohnella soli TaxID=425005 RepID=A0ABW0HJ39_9BACL
MYKLLIVDDESEIRQGLEALDWESMGIQIVGCCENGLIAYQRIQVEIVDILLTDIRMPFMDGLELIQQVARRYPYIKTVILTGHDDFSYAKQGIRSGVSDFLLKPVNDGDIQQTFRRITKELDEMRLVEVRNTALERKAKLSAYFLRQRFMQKMLFQSLSPDEIEEGCSEGEMTLESERYAVMIMRLDRKLEQENYYSHREWDLIMFALDNIFTEVWDSESHGYHWIDSGTGKCYLLCTNSQLLKRPGEEPSMLAEKAAAITESFHRIRGLILSTLSTGIGPVVAQASQIWLSCRTIDQSLTANPQKQITIAERILLAQPEVVKNDSMRRGPETSLKEESAQAIIESVKRYIDQNYERSITLQDVAEHLHFNANYLSSLFRKVTGTNYIHYLTDCRMRQAIKLLQHSSYKVYEISEMVGYSTPAYFIDLFRKHTGNTPHEFRSRLGMP